MLRYLWTVLSVGWTLCTLRNFRTYWSDFGKRWYAANALLNSDVCLDPMLRIELRDFDQCAKAEKATSVSPFQSAIFAVGEDMHICGHGRCEILYVDVTERLTYILCGSIVITCLCILKCARGAQRDYVLAQDRHWKLPALKIKGT